MQLAMFGDRLVSGHNIVHLLHALADGKVRWNESGLFYGNFGLEEANLLHDCFPYATILTNQPVHDPSMRVFFVPDGALHDKKPNWEVAKQSHCYIIMGTKGGTGKTTLAQLLALYHLSLADSVTLIHLDPFGHSMRATAEMLGNKDPNASFITYQHTVKTKELVRQAHLYVMGRGLFHKLSDEIPTIPLSALYSSPAIVVDLPQPGLEQTKETYIPYVSHAPIKTKFIIASLPAQWLIEEAKQLVSMAVGREIPAHNIFILVNEFAGTRHDVSAFIREIRPQVPIPPENIIALPRLAIPIWNRDFNALFKAMGFVRDIFARIATSHGEKAHEA